jgi:hypothetical protein
MFHAIDHVFRPLAASDPPARQEPISIKKLQKGDANWSTRKTMLGWVVDSMHLHLELPDHRRLRLEAILDSLPRTKTRLAVKTWHKVMGELRSMTLAVPGLRGLFSLLQEAFRHKQQGRIRLTNNLHDFLDDIRWIVKDLEHRHTHLHELVPEPAPFILGATDACAKGMGGVFYLPHGTHYTPCLWRQPFPEEVQRQVISWSNPHGTITNSDLELAATMAQLDIIAQHAPVSGRTLHTLTDNTPALHWQRKGSTTTTGPAAYLLRLAAILQRHYGYCPQFSHIPGTTNAMADDTSRLWHLSDPALLTHFHSLYPQNGQCWQLCHLRPAMHTSLISALHKQRPEPASFLAPKTDSTPIGTSGSSSAPSLAYPPTYPRPMSLTPSPSSWFSAPASAMDGTVVAASLSALQQWIQPCVTWARRWPTWGPLTLG